MFSDKCDKLYNSVSYEPDLNKNYCEYYVTVYDVVNVVKHLKLECMVRKKAFFILIICLMHHTDYW